MWQCSVTIHGSMVIWAWHSLHNFYMTLAKQIGL
jgi:hypothetical protein